jgi:hypothetical protein
MRRKNLRLHLSCERVVNRDVWETDAALVDIYFSDQKFNFSVLMSPFGLTFS